MTLDTIVNIAGLLVGGGGGAFFTWRFMRRKAKAEAVSAEMSATKDMQDLYQQMLADTKTEREDRKQQMEEIRKERDLYKQDRNELREQVDNLRTSFAEWRVQADTERNNMKLSIDTLGRKIEAMRPFLCGDLHCQHRQMVEVLNVKMAESRKKEHKTNEA